VGTLGPKTSTIAVAVCVVSVASRAEIVAVPVAIPVTTPEADTAAMAGWRDRHWTCDSEPPGTFVVSWSVAPIATCARAGEMANGVPRAVAPVPPPASPASRGLVAVSHAAAAAIMASATTRGVRMVRMPK
jgi:hypothetical protein